MPISPNLPFTCDILLPDGSLSQYDHHITRTLSSMKGQYTNETAYEAMVAQEDTILYEVYDIARPHEAGDLLLGLSVVHPGKVGQEYFMTKGHFHAVLNTAEVYYCFKGQGIMVMETPEGDWAAEELRPGKVLYVPPRWAHRAVNTGGEDLVFFFVYPAHAGHDYGAIEQQGFRKLVVEENQHPQIVDNPHWRPPEAR